MSWFTKPGGIFDMGPRFLVLDENRQAEFFSACFPDRVAGALQERSLGVDTSRGVLASCGLREADAARRAARRRR